MVAINAVLGCYEFLEAGVILAAEFLHVSGRAAGQLRVIFVLPGAGCLLKRGELLLPEDLVFQGLDNEFRAPPRASDLVDSSGDSGRDRY
jgi:hypothetical protein